jgi:hypothetical protein
LKFSNLQEFITRNNASNRFKRVETYDAVDNLKASGESTLFDEIVSSDKTSKCFDRLEGLY